MANRRVRPGQKYFYLPVMIDRTNPPYALEEGMEVVVIDKYGCPAPNVMGHCYVSPVGEKSFGLVCTNSLLTKAEYVEHLRSKLTAMESQREATCAS